MNKIRNKYILKYNSIKPNIYSFTNNQVDNFYEHASKDLSINLRKRGKKTLFFYRKKQIGYMSKLLPSSTSKLAFKICRDKVLTEDLLRKVDIPTLDSQLYKESEKTKAYHDILNSKHKSFVLKPIDLAGGKGIDLNITKDLF